MEKEILAIDFDGVIHDYKNPTKGRRMGAPIEGAKEAIIKLSRQYKIVVYGVGGGTPKFIEDWLKYFGIPYDEVTNIKPNAKYYIDDKAIRFIDWKQALQEII